MSWYFWFILIWISLNIGIVILIECITRESQVEETGTWFTYCLPCSDKSGKPVLMHECYGHHHRQQFPQGGNNA